MNIYDISHSDEDEKLDIQYAVSKLAATTMMLNQAVLEAAAILEGLAQSMEQLHESLEAIATATSSTTK